MGGATAGGGGPGLLRLYYVPDPMLHPLCVLFLIVTC